MSQRICVPDRAFAGLDVEGVRYRAKDGVMTVDNPRHAAAMLRNGEAFVPAEPVRAAGFVCEDCGFHALFRTCGRCGGTCHRPGEHDASTQA